MISTKPRLLLDVDGVLADFTTPALQFLESIGKQKKFEQILSWDVFEADDEVERLFKEKVATKPGFCLNLSPLRGSIEFVQKAKENYSVEILTTPYNVPNWYDERKDWIVKHYGIQRSHITFTHKKQHYEGEIFVDDKLENVVNWHKNWHEKRECLAVINDQPWNRLQQDSDGNWKNVDTHVAIKRATNFHNLSEILVENGFPNVFEVNKK